MCLTYCQIVFTYVWVSLSFCCWKLDAILQIMDEECSTTFNSVLLFPVFFMFQLFQFSCSSSGKAPGSLSTPKLSSMRTTSASFGVKSSTVCTCQEILTIWNLHLLVCNPLSRNEFLLLTSFQTYQVRHLLRRSATSRRRPAHWPGERQRKTEALK